MAAVAFWTTTLAAAAPILIAGALGAADGWTSTGDDGFVELRSWDVFSRHPPLLGTWSSATLWTHRLLNHPGPMQFYALAIPARVLGPAAGIAIGTALVNAAAVVSAAWLARRRAGPMFGMFTALAIAGLAWSIGGNILYDPWSQYAPIFPFVLFIFAAWSIADGDEVGLPFAVIAGSFALETHLSYVLLVPGVAVVALASYGFRWWRERSASSASTSRRLWWLGGSAALLFACWAPPLYEQTHANGNISALLVTARMKPPNPPGVHGALQATGDVVGVPPFWLPPTWDHPGFHLRGTGRPLPLLAICLLAIVVVGAVVANLARRRGDRAVTAGLLVAVAVSAIGFVSVAHSTSPYGLVSTYVRWLWPISMFVWLVLGLAVVRALQPWLQRVVAERPLARQLTTRSLAVSVGLVALTTAVGIAVDSSAASPPWSVPVSKTVVQQALPRLRGRGPLLVQYPPSYAATSVAPALLAALTTHGIPFVVSDPPLLRQVGDARAWNGHNARLRVLIVGGSIGPNHFARLERIAYVPALSPTEQREMYQLQARITERIRAAGGVELTPIGRRAIAKHTISTLAVHSIIHSRTDPQLITNSQVIHDLTQRRVIDLQPLGQADVLRYEQLADKWINQTVVLVAEPLT